MAKKNGTTKWILVTIAVLTAVVSIAGTWSVYGDNTKDNEKAIVKLEKDGCKPAQGHTTDIKVIENRLETMQNEQRKAFTEILKRLPENEP